jgi:DNA-binding NarL/FixJ family response regulator
MQSAECKMQSDVGHAPLQAPPQRLKVLHITTPRWTGKWLAAAVAENSQIELSLEEAVGQTSGLKRLRDEVFDALFVSHAPGELDALELVRGYRATGADEPILVLGNRSEAEMAAECYQAGADGYVNLHSGTMATLACLLARAVERYQLIRENQRLSQAEQTRLRLEHDEARRMLSQQWSLVGIDRGLKGTVPFSSDENRDSPQDENRDSPQDENRDSPPDDRVSLPDDLVAYYCELLRTHVIMGFGNLGVELRQLADMLVGAGLSARQAVQLHLEAVERLLRGLGGRSSRHVTSRADLLLIELLMYLAEAVFGLRS